MSGRRFTFGMTELMLFTVLCALVGGLVPASRHETAVRGIRAVAFSPDGRLLAVRCASGVAIWDVTHPRAWPTVISDRRLGSSFSDGGTWFEAEPALFVGPTKLATVVWKDGYGASLVVYDVARHRVLTEIKFSCFPSALAVSPEAQIVVSCSPGPPALVDLWSLETGRREGQLQAGGS